MILDVVAVYNNPIGWASRLANFHRCEDGLLATRGVRLTTVELAYGQRPFALPDRGGVRRVRLRSGDALWHKENLINIGFEAIPGWRWGAGVDGDLEFHDPLWALRTVDALQLHKVAQISTDLVFLGPRGQHAGHGVSFMQVYNQAHRRHHCGKWYRPPQPCQLPRHGYPGGAWAWRRDAFEEMGGLFEECILGAGDNHMALALTGLPDPLLESTDFTRGYRYAIAGWRERAAAAIGGSIGVVEGLVFHLWHGRQAPRGYATRNEILARNKYDPATDLVRGYKGLLGLAGNKPLLRKELYDYFAGRDEDSVDLDPGAI